MAHILSQKQWFTLQNSLAIFCVLSTIIEIELDHCVKSNRHFEPETKYYKKSYFF